MRGFFVTFEGGEGTGKSTQIRILDKSLNSLGFKTLLTREPGGSTGAEATRHVLLSGAAEKFGAEMEALLFAAARNDHVRQVIRPAIASGKIVLCDRFMDSSRVYQGVTGKLDRDFMGNLERVAVDGQKPDLTIMLDLDPVVGLQRAASRGVAADRYEKENLALHEERRKAFLAIAKAEPDRCVVVDAGQNQSAIAKIVLGHVVDRIAVQKA